MVYGFARITRCHATSRPWRSSSEYGVFDVAEVLGVPDLAAIDRREVGCGGRFTQAILDRDIPIRSYTCFDVEQLADDRVRPASGSWQRSRDQRKQARAHESLTSTLAAHWGATVCPSTWHRFLARLMPTAPSARPPLTARPGAGMIALPHAGYSGFCSGVVKWWELCFGHWFFGRRTP